MSITGQLNHEQSRSSNSAEFAVPQYPGIDGDFSTLHTMLWQQDPQWLLAQQSKTSPVIAHSAVAAETINERVDTPPETATDYTQASKQPEQYALSDDPQRQELLQNVYKIHESVANSQTLNLEMFNRIK